MAGLAVARRRLAAVCAVIVMLFTAIIGLEYALNRDFGIDQLLGAGYITEGGSTPGRMSPIAALCYFLCGLALLRIAMLRTARYSSAIAGTIGSMLVGIGTVLFLVYLLTNMPVYGWGHFRHISVQASAVVAILGVGVLLFAIEESRAKRTLPDWLPLATAFGLAAGTVGIWQALIVHPETHLLLLSHLILVGGIVAALLVAVAVYLAQKAVMRSRELHQGKEAYERLFEASLDALLVLDHSGQIIAANERVQRILGYTRDEIIGVSIESLVPVHLRDQHRIHSENYNTDPRKRTMGQGSALNARRKDGSTFPVEVSFSPVQSGGELQVLAAVRDITLRKQLEEDLECTRAQAIASARLSALGMMAGGIAHEINNPVGIIHAMASDLAETAKEGSVTPEGVARKGKVIRQTAERIARIVRSLRQISREGGSDPMRPTPLAKIVAETLEICRARFEANNVELILPQIVPELSVTCREVQIAQALLNLLQNAFDAVLEQDGERWVRLEVENGDHTVALSVIDSGPGIPRELRSHIGEPFFTTKPVGKGTGLGLSLSKTIAEDHGGSLEYSDDHGRTRFSLVLPLAGKLEAA
jgi:PAS domain S-box-containing protein